MKIAIQTLITVAILHNHFPFYPEILQGRGGGGSHRIIINFPLPLRHLLQICTIVDPLQRFTVNLRFSNSFSYVQFLNIF